MPNKKYKGRGGHNGKGRKHLKGRAGDKTPTADPFIVIEEKDLRQLFTSNVHFDQHYDWQEKNRQKYLATLAVLRQNGTDIKDGSKVKVLAAGWARHDHEFVNTLLAWDDLFGVVEVLKALTILDSKRKQFEWEKKLKKLLQTENPKSSKIGKIKSNVDNLQAIRPKVGSVSGAVCRHVQRWVRTLPKSRLEFYALHFPKDKWTKLADICHLNPSRDFPELQWFLPYCFGTPAPEESIVNVCTEMNKDNINNLLGSVEIPFSHLKALQRVLNEASKIKIAQFTNLDTIIWNYEDLACPGTDEIILKRLLKKEEVSLPYGKLMERLLMLRLRMKRLGIKIPFYEHLVPIAEKHLKTIEIPLEAPVVVIGDMSPSMGVAIRVSTIIASLFAVLAKAKLVFFNSVNYTPPTVPKTTIEALNLALTLNTTGNTCPGASLLPFYTRKEVVKTFIVVTDEEENMKCNDMYFHDIFKLYYNEVYPAKLVFVSFLSGQHTRGRMVANLKLLNLEVLQFKLDSHRPDLTKLDNLLGLLAVESAAFDEQVASVEADIVLNGLKETFKKLKL